jgi:hypothetical protein
MMIVWLFVALMYIDAGSIAPDIVTVSVYESTVYVGESNRVEIGVNVKEGYHIQANEVKDESLIPTTLEVNTKEFLTIGRQEFPPSRQFKLEGTDSALCVFDGKFIIKLFVKSVNDAPEGKHLLTARLRYQACDSNKCFFPKTLEFLIPLEIKARK